VNSTVPAFLIVRDRLTPLTDLVGWLERAGFDKIWLIDNDSTYPPLLDYLASTPHNLIRTGRNYGHRSPWLSGAVQRHAHGCSFVVSDPDVIPDPSCPIDAVSYFESLLERYPDVDKVGFGLRIDDLPDHYPLASSVRAWEQRFWDDEIEPGVFRANIDTTLALYRALDRRHSDARALRTGHPYVARHTPWYIDPAHLSEEDRWYREHADRSTANWDREELPRWKQRWLSAQLQPELGGSDVTDSGSTDSNLFGQATAHPGEDGPADDQAQ